MKYKLSKTLHFWRNWSHVIIKYILLTIPSSQAINKRYFSDVCNPDITTAPRLTRNSGTIISPNYPHKLHKPNFSNETIKCRWLIEAEKNSKVAIHIVDFDIFDIFRSIDYDIPSDCSYVSLKINSINEGEQNGYYEDDKKQLAELCLGEDFANEEIVYSRSNIVEIVFQINPSERQAPGSQTDLSGKGILISYIAYQDEGKSNQNNNINHNSENKVMNPRNLPNLISCESQGTDLIQYLSDTSPGNEPCKNVICPAGCGLIDYQKDVFNKEIYYHHESRVCRSGIHDGVFRDRQGGKIKVCGGAEPSEDFKKLYSNGILSYDKRILLVDRPMPMFYFYRNMKHEICKNTMSVLTANTEWRSSSVYNSQDASIAAPNRFSGWSPLNNDTNAWIEVELEKPRVIKELRLQGFKTSVAHMAYVNKFRLKIRNSTKEWKWFTPDRGIVFKDYKMDFIEVNEMKDVEVRFTFYTTPIFQAIKIFVGNMPKLVKKEHYCWLKIITDFPLIDQLSHFSALSIFSCVYFTCNHVCVFPQIR